MRRRLILAVAILALAAGTAAPAWAQGLDEETIAEADFRIGRLWPLEDATTAPSVGGRFALFFWTPEPAPRLSVQIIGDYRRLSQRVAPDPEFGFDTEITRNLFMIGPSLGFDVVRLPRFEMDVRGGGVLVAERTTLSLGQSSAFFSACQQFEFAGRCSSDYGFAGTVGAGLRVLITERFYAGLDYTRVFHDDGLNLLVASVGFRIRE